MVTMNKPTNLRVLILHPALAPYRVDLFNALSNRVDLKVVFLQKNAVSQSFDQSALLEKCRFKYEWLLGGFSLRGHYFRFGLQRLLKVEKPDIVISHEFLGVSLQVALLLSFRRLPAHLIWTAENPKIFSSHGFFRSLIKRAFFKVMRGVIVYTKQMELIYREEFSFTAPAAVVPNIPATHAYRDLLRASEQIAREWVSKYRWKSTKLILFVGRLESEKAIHRLLRAVAELEGASKEWALVIVGDGSEKKTLERLSVDLGISESVVFMGRLEGLELHALYRLATLFVLPSVYEAFGAVVNEALLAGVPVICTHEVGAKVWIKNGENGMVIDGNAPSELGEQINIWLQKGSPAGERVDTLSPSLLSIDLETVVDELVDTLTLISESNKLAALSQRS